MGSYPRARPEPWSSLDPQAEPGAWHVVGPEHLSAAGAAGKKVYASTPCWGDPAPRPVTYLRLISHWITDRSCPPAVKA